MTAENAVLKLQKNLNKVGITVKESGDYDEATAEAVAKLQKKAGLPQTGEADAKTLDAAVPRIKVEVKGKGTYYVTPEEHKKIQKAAKAAAAKAVAGYSAKAKEARQIAPDEPVVDKD